jgi:DNA-binding transcriptional LysR family regulator
MDYTLRQLQMLVMISETGSLSRTAAALNLSQPAVSIQIKNLQQHFDIPLTEVIGRKLFLTEFGYDIAESAKSILKEIENIESKGSAYKGQLSGRLKITIVSTGKYVMPYFLVDFIHKNPKVSLQMDVTNKATVVESLSNNDADFSLVSFYPGKMKFEKIALMPNQLFLIAASSIHKTTKRFNPRWLEETPLIYREEGSGTRQAMESYIQQHNVRVKKSVELTSNEAVKQAVIAGLGYSIMPLIGIRQELNNGSLKIINAPHTPIESMWNLIWTSKKKLSPVAKAYLDYIRNNKTRIIKEKFAWLDQFSKERND